MEIIITIFYWTILHDPEDWSDDWVHNATLSGDHIVPMGVLLIEYCINQMPIVPRHLWMMLPICVAYMIDNFAATKITGSPIYPPIDWATPLGYIAAFGIFIFAIVVYLGVSYLNNIKLAKNGSTLFLMALKDDIRTVTNPEAIAKEKDIFG